MERRTTPSGFVYSSLFDLADYGDYETLDHETMESEYYNSFVGKFVKNDEPDSGKAGPSRIPTYSERIGKVTVEEFELPSCYGTGSGFAARNFSDDESSDSSDDDEIAHGIAHHEKRLLRYEARLNRWNKRNPGHGGSFPRVSHTFRRSRHLLLRRQMTPGSLMIRLTKILLPWIRLLIDSAYNNATARH